MPGRREVDWTDAELAQEARCAALDELVAALTTDEAWIEGCLAVRRGDLSADALAGRYVRHGCGRAVIAAIAAPPERDVEGALQALAGMESREVEREALKLAQLNLGREVIGPTSPVDRSRWRSDGTRYREAAAILIARGAGRCQDSGCEQVLGDGRPYCSAHQGRATHHRRADLDAVQHLLRAAAVALDI